MKKGFFLAVLAFGLVVTDAAFADRQVNGVWRNGLNANAIWQNGLQANGTGSGAMTIEGVELVGGQLRHR